MQSEYITDIVESSIHNSFQGVLDTTLCHKRVYVFVAGHFFLLQLPPTLKLTTIAIAHVHFMQLICLKVA